MNRITLSLLLKRGGSTTATTASSSSTNSSNRNNEFITNCNTHFNNSNNNSSLKHSLVINNNNQFRKSLNSSNTYSSFDNIPTSTKYQPLLKHYNNETRIGHNDTLVPYTNLYKYHHQVNQLVSHRLGFQIRNYTTNSNSNNNNKEENKQENNNNNQSNNENNNNVNNQELFNQEQQLKKRIFARDKGVFLLVSRIMDRLKFVMTRHKPLTSDQMFAIFSWLLFGTGSLIILGTTTLVSLILWLVNTFEFSEWTAKKIGKYLTNNTGINITFDHARGEWKTGYIRLENVTVSRKPKGDERLSAIQLSIKQIDIKLSILWMLEGKGIIEECLVTGVRGIIDRRTEGIFLNYSDMVYPRRKKAKGDFVFKRLDIKDLLISYHLPDPTHRPLSISIFSLESDRFRKQWLLYDVLSCKNIVGKFDGSLFTYTIPQKETVDLNSNRLEQRELKIDGVNIKMLSRNATGPLGWIKEGTFDINLKLLVPSFSEYDILETETDKYEYGVIPLDKDPFKNVHLQFSVALNHLYSTAPLYTPQISYLSNALAHPIVAYINSHSKRIPLQFTFSMNVRQYNGSWTLSQASFWELLSDAVGQELVNLVQEKKNVTTLKEVASELLNDFMGWIVPIVENSSKEYQQLLKEELDIEQQRYIQEQQPNPI